MSLWLDECFLKQVSHAIEGFVQKDKHLWNCRCMYCGDSKKHKRKKRGYFFPHNKEPILVYNCKNCGVSTNFAAFLNEFDHNLYLNYKYEKFKEEHGVEPTKEEHVEPIQEEQKTDKITRQEIFDSLPAINELSQDHEAYRYILKRKLPMNKREMYFAENFIAWTQTNTDKFENWKGNDHPRIIFPFRSRCGKVIGYSARSLHGEEPKYYRIFVDDSEEERYFGINLLDESKQVFVLEGEVDSMYLPNAIAVSNAKLDTYMNPNAIYIPDADRRNIHVVNGIEKMVNKGLRVCFIPDNLGGKDIGELVENGMTTLQLLQMIRDNTYQGLKAKLFFTAWRKIK